MLTHTTETGHRIPGHDGGTGKCARLHGHTYRFNVTVNSALLDDNGFVLDFGVIKATLDEWDHRLLLWADDPLYIEDGRVAFTQADEAEYGLIRVPFVPTAENMAEHLAKRFLTDHDHLQYVAIDVHETPKSTATYWANRYDLTLPTP